MLLLKSEDRPEGWPLDTLLTTIREDLKDQNNSLREKLMTPGIGGDRTEVYTDVLHNNLHIIRALNDCLYLQKDSNQRLDWLEKAKK